VGRVTVTVGRPGIVVDRAAGHTARRTTAWNQVRGCLRDLGPSSTRSWRTTRCRTWRWIASPEHTWYRGSETVDLALSAMTALVMLEADGY